MMVKILLFTLMLLLPVCSDAAYSIYLTNGSVITGVKSYEKRGGEIKIHFGEGTIVMSGKDILKIEETEAPLKDFRSNPNELSQNPRTAASSPHEQANDKSPRVAALKAELEVVKSEIKNLEDKEASVTAAVNEKRNRRARYNVYQLRQLEKETEPLQQELFGMQMKKKELLQRKSGIEDELRTME